MRKAAFALAEVFSKHSADCRRAAFTLAEFFSRHSVDCRKAAFTLAEVFSRHSAGRRKVAFTLAEVLITLGIIGVVAAMTLPTLVAKYQKTAAIAALKENYALLQSAAQYGVSKYGEPIYWDGLLNPWGNIVRCENDRCDKFVNIFLENIKKVKYYPAEAVPSGPLTFCGSDKTYHFLWKANTLLPETGDGRTNITQASLPNGACWLMYYRGGMLNDLTVPLMHIYVDINGPGKNPNRLGLDVFIFQLLGNGKIIPWQLDDCKYTYKDSGRGKGYASKIISDGWQIKDDYPWDW